jgi:hypothetical protein
VTVAKAARVAAGRKVRAVSEDETGEARMCLTELEMTKLNLHEQRVEMNKIQGEKFTMQEQLLNLEYIKGRDGLRKRQAECVAAMERAKDDYNGVRMAVQTRLGINLNDYTVNEAGQLTPLPRAE